MTKTTLAEINILFDTLKDALEEYTNSKDSKSLSEENLGFLLVKMESEETDLAFSGNEEHACRAILGLLKAFKPKVKAEILMSVTEILVDNFEKEKKEKMKDFSPIMINPSKTLN